MKYILVLVFAVSCVAQTVTTPWVTTWNDQSITTALGQSLQIGPADKPEPQAKNFLLEYSHNERCYECNTRYAVNCGTPDCNVPWKSVDETEWFESVDASINFLEKNPQFEYKSLWKIGPEVKLSVKKYQVQEPQPPKEHEAKKYQAEK